MKSLAEEPKADYKSKYKDIREINKEQRERIRDGTTRVEQLTVSYIFAQLLMLLMSSCSSASFDKNKWIPFSLLSLVSFIFWLSIIPTVSELLGILYEYDLSFMKQQIIFHRMYLVENSTGESQQQESSSGGYILKPDKDTLYRRYAYVIGLFSALLGFTGVMFYACHAFLREADGIIGKP